MHLQGADVGKPGPRADGCASLENNLLTGAAPLRQQTSDHQRSAIRVQQLQQVFEQVIDADATRKLVLEIWEQRAMRKGSSQ